MDANNKTAILSILCFCGAILLIIIGHYIYIWDRGKRDKNQPPMYNINGKRIYTTPQETGLHLVLSFIIILLMGTLGFICATKQNTSKSISEESLTLSKIEGSNYSPPASNGKNSTYDKNNYYSGDKQ